MKIASSEELYETINDLYDDLDYELEVSEEKRRNQKIVILVLIIFLILLLLLCFRLGNIGFKRVIFSEVENFSLSEKKYLFRRVCKN